MAQAAIRLTSNQTQIFRSAKRHQHGETRNRQHNMNPYNLADTFAVLKPDLSIDPVTVSLTVYRDLDRNYAGFKSHTLVSRHAFDMDWPTWERHPAGDELVCLLSGQADLILRTPRGDEVVNLAAAGSFVLVPRNTWHTAHISEPTELLFITPGEGTENVETPEDLRANRPDKLNKTMDSNHD